jgi:aldehyde:ferredoxin oxidoreductase
MKPCLKLSIGDLLAEGTANVARKIGGGSEKFAVHVKGLDAGMHEPRLKLGLGLGFMVNPMGADHCCNTHDPQFATEAGMKPLHALGLIDTVPTEDIGPRKVNLFRLWQLKSIFQDCLVVCFFPFMVLPNNLQLQAELTAAVTGWDTGLGELLRVAERVLTLARLFNIREGLTADDDVLPERYFQPKTDGPLSNKPLDRAKMDRARLYYYTLMGWDAQGVPLPEKIEELQIE